MDDKWKKIEKCKECGNTPYVIPKGKSDVLIMCDHGKQLAGIKSYSLNEWNELNSEEPTNDRTD